MSSTLESTPTGETSLFQDAEEKGSVIRNAETSQQVVVSEALVPPLPAAPPAVVTAGQKRKSETQLTNPTNATKQKNNATPSKSTGGKSGSKLPMSKAREIRLEQNRKAARESRRRKKVMIEELQRSVIFFSRANSLLKQQNEEWSRMLIQAQAFISQQHPQQNNLSQGAMGSITAEANKTATTGVTPVANPQSQPQNAFPANGSSTNVDSTSNQANNPSQVTQDQAGAYNQGGSGTNTASNDISAPAGATGATQNTGTTDGAVSNSSQTDSQNTNPNTNAPGAPAAPVPFNFQTANPTFPGQYPLNTGAHPYTDAINASTYALQQQAQNAVATANPAAAFGMNHYATGGAFASHPGAPAANNNVLAQHFAAQMNPAAAFQYQPQGTQYTGVTNLVPPAAIPTPANQNNNTPASAAPAVSNTTQQDENEANNMSNVSEKVVV